MIAVGWRTACPLAYGVPRRRCPFAGKAGSERPRRTSQRLRRLHDCVGPPEPSQPHHGQSTAVEGVAVFLWRAPVLPSELELTGAASCPGVFYAATAVVVRLLLCTVHVLSGPGDPCTGGGCPPTAISHPPPPLPTTAVGYPPSAVACPPTGPCPEHLSRWWRGMP